MLSVVLATGCQESGSASLTEQLELGQRYLEELDYESAIVAFQKAIEIDPKAMDAYVGLAEAHMALGNMEEALAAAEQGIAVFEGLEDAEKTEERTALYENLLEIAERLRGELDAKSKSAVEESQAIQDDSEDADEGETTAETTEASIAETEITVAETMRALETEAVLETTAVPETTIPETLPPAVPETTAPVPAETVPIETSAPTEPIPTETASGAYTLNITAPLPTDVQWGTYHLSDAIGGITDITTIGDLEAQIPGLRCEIVSGKDDYVVFYKEGVPLFCGDTFECFNGLSIEEYDMINGSYFSEADVYYEGMPEEAYQALQEKWDQYENAIREWLLDKTFTPSAPIGAAPVEAWI